MSVQSTARSLQGFIEATPDLVSYLYNDSPGAHSRGRQDLTPVRPEFTNWRDEQRAWRESAVLFDQSHHMPELFVSGPDAFALLNYVGINSLKTLEPGRAKQYIGCTPDGHMIGDCILYALADGSFELVSSSPLLNWVQFQAEAGEWDVAITRDDNTSDNPTGARTKFRYQLAGPEALSIFDAVIDEAPLQLGFFRTATVTVAGVEVLVLGHSMSGYRGVEISGPYEQRDIVRQAILDAGTPRGLLQGGTKTYYSASFEGGWMAYPLPAVYTGEALRPYREWLPDTAWEARFQLAGSFTPDSIEGYYVTPYDMGYGKLVSFDHDFIGRDALEALADQPQKAKVSLVWNPDDVLKVYGSLLTPGVPYKFLELPVADYGNLMHRDEVLDADGNRIGLATKTGYTINERKLLSLAMVDADRVNIGDEVVIVWGEPDGGSRKPQVERHQQLHVRATVAPSPYADVVRTERRGDAAPVTV
ncbi:aminomethyltransferase family protein [Pseudoclavibacter endophyticus]|uniref:Aminomethyl transferase family protein n=1 Tax=Pseudoclavibacter endophyticus TaxID=1778590 RepID=A0A6H9WBM8_9MICO|nr:aminomethyltransferase family protein [Pseudoclavibacter endophyticus]KAB1648063.1 aminomethyl transferase family protein [Pseudoclavibacter endophyticus]